MNRLLRWGLGLALVALVLVGAVLVLPFRSWLPGGTIADVPKSEVVNGTAFNRLFPSPQAGEAIVFTQEKRGFSEARLKQGDQTVALLAISDTTTAPEARDKFSQTSERLQGWPLLEQGSQASALLVAERFQVKVIGQGPGLAVDQRHDLLAGFDLKGLAALQPKQQSKKLAKQPLARNLPAATAPAMEPANSAVADQSSAEQPAFQPTAFKSTGFQSHTFEPTVVQSTSFSATFYPSTSIPPTSFAPKSDAPTTFQLAVLQATAAQTSGPAHHGLTSPTARLGLVSPRLPNTHLAHPDLARTHLALPALARPHLARPALELVR